MGLHMSLRFRIENAPDAHLNTYTRDYKYKLQDFIDVDVNGESLPQAFFDINQNRVLCGAPELSLSEFASIAREVDSLREEFLESVQQWDEIVANLRNRAIAAISQAGEAAREMDIKKAFTVHHLEFSDQNANGYVHLSITKKCQDDIQTHLTNTEYRHGRPVQVQEVQQHSQVDSEISEAGEYSAGD